MFGVALALACLAWGAPLWAAGPAPTALELDYEATLSCPDRAGFLQLVLGHLRGSAVDVGAGSSAQVRLQNEAGAFAGELELTRPDGSRFQRQVSGASCPEVARALSFVLALALGAEAPPLGAEAPPLGSEAPPLGQQPAISPAPVPTSPALPALPATREVPRAAPLHDALPARSVSDARTWRFALGGQLGLRTGLGPTWTTLEGAFLEVRHGGRFKWAARGSFEHTQTVTRVDRYGTTDFSWTAGSAAACPRFIELGARWALVPCLGLHVGALRAAGRPAPLGGAQGRASSELWLDGFSELRLELTLLPALAVQLQGALIVPFTRYLFGFDGPFTPVYQVPALAGAGSLAVVALIP